MSESNLDVNSEPPREEALFQAAAQLIGAERAAFLDAVCASDPSLRQRLEVLLAAHEQTDALLATEPEATRPTLKLELADTPDEVVGQRLGRYKLLEKVGEAGCGVVYVAEQIEPVRRRVALKVIKLGMDTKQVVARFDAERQALAMMDHPNIAKVLDAGTTDARRPFFVMELVRGIRITEYCDQNNLSTKERLDLFIKVCQAIQHAHQKGIIHRDIKPSNILVTLHDGVPVPKVIDFGIAKATEGRLTDATVYTQLHQFIGTPAYMSPEQAEMSGLDIDTRSDIYSLGVLLYELLAGSTPFDAQELMASGIDAMRKTIREKEPVRPSTRLATLKGEELTTTAKRRSCDAPKLIHLLEGDLDWIVMKCLEKDRTRRYETANGLVADLKRHLNNEPVVARPPSATYRFQKLVRRNKLVFTAVTAVAVALVAGLGVSMWQAVRATRATKAESQQRLAAEGARVQAQAKQQEAEAERQRADAQAGKASESQQQSRRLLYASDMNLVQQALKLNNLGRARLLLDRHRPQPGEEDLRGWEWRYLWQLTRSTAIVTLTNRSVRGTSVTLSPNGTRLAVGWSDGRVELWDVANRHLIRALTDGGQPNWGRVAFSPIQNLLAATSATNAVTLYDLDSGRESVLWRAPKGEDWDVRDLAFSQDGSRVVIYAGSDSQELGDAAWVLNVSSAKIEGRHSTEYTGAYFSIGARLSPDNQRLYLPRSDPVNYCYSIRCLDLASGQELWQTERGRDHVLSAFAISPDGRVLVSGSCCEDPTIRVWDPATGRLLRLLDRHTAWVCTLAFSMDGRRLISAGSDQSIRIWDTATWTELKVLRGHRDEVYGLAVSETAHLIASASKDGDLMLWNDEVEGANDGYSRVQETLLEEALPRNGIRGVKGGVTLRENHLDSEAVPLDRSRLLMLPRDKPPELIDLNNGAFLGSLAELGSSSNVLDRVGDGTLCRWDGTNQILLEELRSGDFIRIGAIPLNSNARPTGLARHAKRPLVAWSEASALKSIYLADLTAPGRRIELMGDVPGLIPYRFSTDGSYLVAVAPVRNSLRAWKLDTGKIVTSIDGDISDATFAGGGQMLVVAINTESSHEVGFYDLANPSRAPRLIPGRQHCSHLAVSPDDRLVAASIMNGSIRLFDPAKREEIEPLYRHMNAAFGIAFSPDGRRLISGGGGREAIKLWDVATRQELLTLAGTGSFIHTAIWCAEGDVILAGAPWQMWRAPSLADIEKADARDKSPARQP